MNFPDITDEALDGRIAIVGTSGSGKTYAGKGLVERLLRLQSRVCVVDPLGVWWGLRADAAGRPSGFGVVVFGGRHADVEITDGMGTQLGRIVGTHDLSCVVDLSELGSSAARRRFMAAFAEAIYDSNSEPLHLVMDEADLFAPQRPLPEGMLLLGRIEEIVRRGRVRGFIPWLITQRPAVIHKDVLSQADMLIAMKLTSSQDRDAVGGWIEGQADRADGKRILADLPRLARGEGYIWAPGEGMLARATFPVIATFDSSRTPKRGDKQADLQLAPVDISAIAAALALRDQPTPSKANERTLAPLQARIAELEAELVGERARRADLEERLQQIAGIVGRQPPRLAVADPVAAPARPPPQPSKAAKPSDGSLHPAARKLLAALSQHAPGKFTWGQAATLAGLKPSGGHFNAGRKDLRNKSFIEEAGELVAVSAAGIAAAGDVPPAPSTPAERVAMWCDRLPSPAPEMLRAITGAVGGEVDVDELASRLGKKSTGGHWNSGIAVLRNNGLIEVSGRSIRAAELLRPAS